MQQSDEPLKIVLPFAQGGARRPIPTDSQIGIQEAAASLVDGFPPITRTPATAGGKGPWGLDMNGILYEITGVTRWANAGAGFKYDSVFSSDPNVNGYPKGARILRDDGFGYWLNTVDNNSTDPASAGAAAAGWVPEFTNGFSTINLSSTNVTLTPAEYGFPIILLQGTLLGNINVVLPDLSNQWIVVNNCSGAFTVTVKTASGTGVTMSPGEKRLVMCDGVNVSNSINSTEIANQFDSSDRIATTQFVKRAGVEFSGIMAISGVTALGASDVGKLIVLSGSGYSVALPSAALVPDGAQFQFFSAYSGVTPPAISTTGGDIIRMSSGATLALVSMGDGDTLTLVKTGASEWTASSGSKQIGKSDSFKLVPSGSGYQILPSGLIIQWGQTGVVPAGGGTTIFYPITFPNAMIQTLCSNAFSTGTTLSTSTAGVQYVNSSQFNLYLLGSAAQSGIPWMAIGF
jgi:hypothetical protein